MFSVTFDYYPILCESPTVDETTHTWRCMFEGKNHRPNVLLAKNPSSLTSLSYVAKSLCIDLQPPYTMMVEHIPLSGNIPLYCVFPGGTNGPLLPPPSVEEHETTSVLPHEYYISLNKYLHGKITCSLQQGQYWFSFPDSHLSWHASFESSIVSSPITRMFQYPSLSTTTTSLETQEGFEDGDVLECDFVDVGQNEMSQVFQIPVGSANYNGMISNNVTNIFIKQLINILIVLAVFFLAPLTYDFLVMLLKINDHINEALIKKKILTIRVFDWILIGLISGTFFILMIVGLAIQDVTTLAIGLYFLFVVLFGFLGIRYHRVMEDIHQMQGTTNPVVAIPENPNPNPNPKKL
jgi:hypothetical protein